MRSLYTHCVPFEYSPYTCCSHCVPVEHSPCTRCILTVYLLSTHRVLVGAAHADGFHPGEFLSRRGRVGSGELTAVAQRYVRGQEDAIVRQRHVEQL